MTPRRARLLLLVIVALAAALRLWNLEDRPPHHDEGINGWFTEKIARDGYYRYDPSNYHGPSYFYALAASREAFGFGLWQLRLPAALAGIALCLTPWLLRRRIGTGAALAACALLATSPTLVYYARYAIHETFLAAFGLLVAACVLRWAHRSSPAWLVAAAAAVAGMIATKETTIIFLAVAGVWLVGEILAERWRAGHWSVLGRPVAWSWRVPVTVAAMLLAMATIHAALFTGFFQTPGSIITQLERSFDAYFVWARTGTGHSGHEKDWCYYFHLGVRYELALYVLALAGLVTGFGDRWVRGPGLVGFGMLAAYSAIAYKMPWLPASWLALLALPAARGVALLASVVSSEISERAGARATLILCMIPALAITLRSSFVRAAEPVEQLAYVHTHRDYNQMMSLIDAGGRHLGRERLTIAVDHDAHWPFPWALSRYPRTRWASNGNEDIVVVAAGRASAVETKLAGRYLRRPAALRDAAEPVVVYLRRDLFVPLLMAQR